MMTISEIRAEIANEIYKILESKGYDTTDSIELDEDNQFETEVTLYDKYSDCEYPLTVKVTSFESYGNSFYISGIDSEGVDNELTTDDLTVEQMIDFRKSVSRLPDNKNK